MPENLGPGAAGTLPPPPRGGQIRPKRPTRRARRSARSYQPGDTSAPILNAGADRLAVLRSMIEESSSGPYEFTDRLPLNALGLRFQLDHQRQIADWAACARDQVATWRSPTDAAGRDWRAELRP